MKNRTKVFIAVLLMSLVSIQISPWLTHTQALVAAEANNKNNYYGIVKFYDEKPNSLDVLFIGDSNFYRGIMPTVIWKETGITSYVIASPSQTTWVAYYQLKQALEYQKPKLVILEANQIYEKVKVRQERMVRYVNSMKADSIRMDAATDPSFQLTDEYQFQVLQDIMNGQLAEFKRVMTNEEKTTEEAINYKGFILNVKKVPYTGNTNFMDTNRVGYGIDYDYVSYFDDFIQLCWDNDIEVLLVKGPDATEWSNEGHNITQDFADAEGVPFFDFNTDLRDVTIDWENDTYDGGTHLNVFGAEKVSKDFAHYLKENYVFEEHTDKDVIASFNKGHEVLEKQKEEMVASCNESDDER